jgi:hypothetical protein
MANRASLKWEHVSREAGETFKRSILDLDIGLLAWESRLLRGHGWTVVMAAHEVYQYSELTGEDAIRLIHLQPCDNLETGLECFLKDAHDPFNRASR